MPGLNHESHDRLPHSVPQAGSALVDLPAPDLQRLRYFTAVAEELSFSGAATRLGLSQQALSPQIRCLEEQVGRSLFFRTTRRGRADRGGPRAAAEGSAGSPQMARRLFAALDGLLATAPAARRPPLERQRELLAAAVEDAYDDWRMAEAAQIPDIQGIGSGADVAAAPGEVEGAAR